MALGHLSFRRTLAVQRVGACSQVARDSPVALFAMLASTVCLGYAIQISNGTYNPEAFTWLLVAFALALSPIVLPALPRVDALVAERWMVPAFAVGLAFQFAALVSSSPGIYVDPATGYTLREFQALVAIGAVASGFALARVGRDVRSLGALVLLVFVGLGYWMMKASPNPHIDVFSIHQESIAALLQGHDPYTLTFPNPYHATNWFSPGAATYDRLLFGYVYPAWTILSAVPGYVLVHDYRYSFLAAVAVSGALGTYVRPGPWSLLATSLFLFTPRSFFVLEQGWTEPALLVGIAISVFAAGRRRLGWMLPIGLGIMACAKQYSILAAPAALLLRPLYPSWRAFVVMVAKAIGVALLITLPLALWHPKAYWYDVYGMQFTAPIRPDSLSLPTWWAAKFGYDMPKVLHLGLPAALGVLTVVRARKTASGFAWAVSILYFIFFMFRQGFCNYYYLVVCAQALAVAAASPTVSRPPSGILGTVQ